MDDFKYYWLILLLLTFVKPDEPINSEKVKENIKEIGFAIKESNFNFSDANLENIGAKSQELYDLVREFLN